MWGAWIKTRIRPRFVVKIVHHVRRTILRKKHHFKISLCAMRRGRAHSHPVMAHVSGLRSPYAKVGRLVYFGRMIDKIRLHAAGELPAEYVSNMGDAKPRMFDTFCCAFLGIKHSELAAQVLAGPDAPATPGSDEKLLAWAHAHGAPRTDEECAIWNSFMCKRGWRDEAHARLQTRIAEAGSALAGKKIETFFDYLDADEGRDPAAERPWEKI